MKKTIVADTKNVTELQKGNKIITTHKSPSGRILRRSVKSVNNLPSETQQQFAEECNINNIMATYRRTGQINHLNRSKGIYQELAEFPPSFAEAMEIVATGKAAFGDLPSHVRSRFEHDPQKFIDFLGNPANREEAEKLGILEKAQLQKNDLNESNKQQPEKNSAKQTATPSET